MTAHKAGTESPRPAEAHKEAKELTLDRVTPPRRVEVVKVESDHGAKRQLAQLGILAGAVLCVVRAAPMGGPVLVEVRGSEVAIGRGLARHVRVKLL